MKRYNDKSHKMMLLVLATAMFLPLLACEPTGGLGPAPISVTSYKQMGRTDRKSYTDDRVVAFNATRVLNPELDTPARLDSMSLIQFIGTNDPETLRQLAAMLHDAKAPVELRKKCLLFLLQKNQPDLGPFVTSILQNRQSDPDLYRAALNYISKNPAEQMLPSILRKWAQAGKLSKADEEDYRSTVVRITKAKTWDAALIDALNTKGFHARGEAMEILAARIPKAALVRTILKTKAKTDTFRALQTFAESFDYLPKNAEELTAAAIIYKNRTDMLPDAARLAYDWSKSYDYPFNIRDFHLLSRVDRDPLRTNLKRPQLAMAIGKAAQRRKHVKHKPLAANDYKENFWNQLDDLSITDLWNLYLLDEMLSRPRTQMSIRWIAKGDLADRKTAWGGLVFYQNGQAEAHYYPASPDTGADDLIFHPSKRFLKDARDSMCRFICHFDKIENADRAGPTPEELADAKRNNYYGLLLTRTGKNTFCAHYYNPQGKVVSLGEFPIR